jgi:protein tyrosine phosphatase
MANNSIDLSNNSIDLSNNSIDLSNNCKYNPSDIKSLTEKFISLPEGNSVIKVATPLHDRYYDVLPGENIVNVCWNNKPLYVNANCVFDNVIATQAPCISGIMRFWLMVAQYNISLIVMLTRLYEGSRNKADIYWPTSAHDMEFKDNAGTVISIKLLDECQQKGVITRKLQISYLGEKTEVKHIQYIAWPDRGVPKDTTIIKNIICEMSQNSQQTVVHCSAGVGRTGVLLAIYKLMNNTESHPIEVVEKIRKCRPTSIQNQLQFEFVLRTVNELSQHRHISPIVERIKPLRFQHSHNHGLDSLNGRELLLSSVGIYNDNYNTHDGDGDNTEIVDDSNDNYADNGNINNIEIVDDDSIEFINNEEFDDSSGGVEFVNGGDCKDISRTDIPHTDIPRTDIPHTDIPHTDIPRTDIPHTDIPHTDISRTDIPRTDIKLSMSSSLHSISATTVNTVLLKRSV